MTKNPYKILGITRNTSIEEIKKIYKKIALECHPDKTLNKPDNIRDIMNLKFKEATEAYKIIIDNPNIDYTNWDDNYYYENYENYNYNDWFDMFSEFINTSEAKSYISNIAEILKNNNIIKNKKFYKFANIPLIHKVNLNVTYKELINNTKKKVQLLLKNISEPILITVYSLDSFPSINKIYIDDDDLTDKKEIKIKIIKNELFTHKIINNKINIYYKLKYNLYDYLNGYITRIKYIDDEYIDINIPKFISKKYEIKDKGINGGSFIIKIKLRNTNINIDNWNKLEDTEKDNFNKILFRIL